MPAVCSFCFFLVSAEALWGLSLSVSGDDAVSVEAEVTVSSLRWWTTARVLFVGAVTATAKKSVTPRATRDDLSAPTKLKHTIKNTSRAINVDQSSPAPVPTHPSCIDWSLGNLPATLLNVTLLFLPAPNRGSYRAAAPTAIHAICYKNPARVATCLEFPKDGGGASWWG